MPGYPDSYTFPHQFKQIKAPLYQWNTGKDPSFDIHKNAAINIRDNYITRALKLGQAAVNQPYGWRAIGKPETEPVGKTLTSKPSGLPKGRWPLWNSDSIHAKIL